MGVRPILAAVLSAFLLAAAPATAAETRAIGPDPAVTEWPEWPHRVICGFQPFSPVAAFSTATGVEREKTPQAAALRRYLRLGLPYERMRMRDWRVLVETPGAVEFASGRLGDQVEVVIVEKERGRWRGVGSSSNCEPSTLRKRRAAITWTLDPIQPQIRPETRVIEVNLGPGECSGGRSQNKRLMKPEFREQNGALLMTLWLRPLPPGFYTCQGLVEPPVKIKLPGPLGQLKLLDGGTYPPGSGREDVFERPGT